MIRSLSIFLTLASVLAAVNEEDAHVNVANNRQLLDLATIGAFVGIVSGGISIGAGISGYGLKISISNKMCQPLNYQGLSVTTHGSPTTQCRDIDVGIKEVCVYSGLWNLGSEGMFQYEIGYGTTGKALNIYYRASAGWGMRNHVHMFFGPVLSNPDDLWQYWDDCFVAHEGGGHHEYCWQGPVTDYEGREYVVESAMNIEAEGYIGSGNNPVLNIDVAAVDKEHFGTCDHNPSAKSVQPVIEKDTISENSMMIAAHNREIEAGNKMIHAFMTLSAVMVVIVVLLCGWIPCMAYKSYKNRGVKGFALVSEASEEEI